jgi:hypothetical protein
MISNFYTNTTITISIVLFYLLIAITIAILVINGKIVNSMSNNNTNEFEKNIKTQKALIWINYTIAIIMFIMSLITSIYLFSGNGSQILSERKTGFITLNFILFCIIAINTGMSYYMNKILNEVKITDNKNEINKIYIIVSFLSIVSILCFMQTFSKSQAVTRSLSNYYTYEQPYSIRSITRTSPLSTPSLTAISRNRQSSLNYDFENDFY